MKVGARASEGSEPLSDSVTGRFGGESSEASRLRYAEYHQPLAWPGEPIKGNQITPEEYASLRAREPRRYQLEDVSLLQRLTVFFNCFC